jgi:peptidoglycan/xylan/chitin deacetylase (PgdA/CDA1 family)
MVFVVALNPSLSGLAHAEQFSYQTTILKNQINNNSDDKSMSSYNFSTSTVSDNISNSSTGKGNSSTNKVVILNFYDDAKSQMTNAKPILDKYGFKGTFFIVCDWVGRANSQTPRLTSQDISQLHRQGHDIESHSMTHKRLNTLSASALNQEVGQSKQCLYDHLGINATIFSPPHQAGWDNASVINAIAKYYDLSIGGFVDDVMFLHCYGWTYPQQVTGLPWLLEQQQQPQQRYTNQTDCRTYSKNGTLNFANKYDIKEISHNSMDKMYSYNDTAIFQRFVEIVNSQVSFNKNTTINAVPIIAYHDIDNRKADTSTDINLFLAEMKYLYDNGFKALTVSDLGYNENSKYLYIKGITPNKK